VDRLRFVEPTTGNLRLELNGSSTGTDWQLGRGLDIGRQNVEKTYIAQPPFSGATLAAVTPQLVTMSVPLFLPRQPTLAAAKLQMSRLAAELARKTNIIELRLPGDTTSVFMDTFRANIPTIIQGGSFPSPYFYKASILPVILEIDRLPDIRTAVTGGTTTYV
jgi:hypothetical protein